MITRALLATAGIALLLVPATAQARPGDRDTTFGRRGTVSLKAINTDAVGGAVKALSGGRVLAGGSAGGQLVVVGLRKTGALDSRFGALGQVVPALPGTSQDGVRALATFRDGRIVAAGTLTLADGSTRFVALRLLPTGEVDPSFGAGLGYVLTGPAGAQLGAMVMDVAGNVILGGSRPAADGGEVPIVIRLLPDGTPDPAFAAGGTLDGAAYGWAGRVTGLLARALASLTFTIGAGPGRSFPAVFSTVRVGPTGAPDPTFNGSGVVAVPLGPGTGVGVGAAALRGGPNGSTLVAGTDLTPSGRLRGAVIRLQANGTLDARFARTGVARVARSGRDIQITAMVRDSQGRILLAGNARPPTAIVVRLRASGARDKRFGNGGLTYTRFGRPPGGDPIYTTLAAIDAAGSRALLAGAAAGPGALVRSATGTLYTGRFALTVSRLR